jgi:putative sterol carrier protein
VTATLQRFGDLRVGAPVELPASELDCRYTGDLTAAGLVLAAADRLRPCADATLRGVEWSGGSGVVSAVRATVTRRRVADGAGRLHQTLRLLGPEPAGSALLAWSVEPAQHAPTARDLALDDIASVDWGRRLADRLDADPDFRSSASTFDGALGIRSGAAEVQLRLYRGRVVEAARKSLDGATFTISADELTWLELLTGEYDEYVRFAAAGRFRIVGSGFQYLRLTRTVRVLIGHARAMVAEVDG